MPVCRSTAVVEPVVVHQSPQDMIFVVVDLLSEPAVGHQSLQDMSRIVDLLIA